MMAAMARSRPDGWWYPWTFVAGMAIVIAVNVGLAFLAVSTFPGLETTDHYRKGLAYNRDLAAAEAQAQRGWQLQVDFEPAQAVGPSLAGTVTAVFADRDGVPLGRLAVQVYFTRPTHEGFDRKVVLDHLSAGRYQAPVTLPLRGVWDARIVAGIDDIVFQETRRLVVP
jgi:nitrogen fixation protein FixH